LWRVFVHSTIAIVVSEIDGVFVKEGVDVGFVSVKRGQLHRVNEDEAIA
jgi:hypothetical protein